MSISRRRFFASSGALAGSALAFPHVRAGEPSSAGGLGAQPRHIIHLVADGMSWGTLTCANLFSSLVRQQPLAWMELYRRPDAAIGLVDMRSLNSTVTDSAAASSSWGSGSRVKNGSLNVLPDDRALKPLCSVFAEAGWARGLVTTTEITHATPAGFAANVASRGSADTIAEQYLERRIDVLLGGGSQYFDPAKRKDKRNLKQDFATAGYTVMTTRAELLRASSQGRCLGLFSPGHLPFTIDRNADGKLREQVPTLAEMTTAALERLSHSGRFLLQVEGGRVDHAAHGSDAAAAMHDQVAFDDALFACLQFQREVPDTLVVVTTDHGNSNLGLNGMGDDYEKSPALFANVARVKRSFGLMLKELALRAAPKSPANAGATDDPRTLDFATLDAGLLRDVIEESTGWEMPRKRAEHLLSYLSGARAPLYDSMNSPSTLLGQSMANYLGIGWTGNAHTADYVALVALGPGSDRFRGFLENTDFFPHYLSLAGVRFRNPQLPLLAESGPSAEAAERAGMA